MKKIIYLCMPVLFFLVGCTEEGEQLFTDDMSYFSFTEGSSKIGEMNMKDTIYVDWAKVAGKSGELEVEIVTEGVTNPAKEGVDFTLSSNKITFDAKTYTAFLVVNTIDNDERTGDKSFIIRMKSNTANAMMGTANDGNDEIMVTIIDDEHPFAAILGTYRMSYTRSSGASGGEDVSIVADENQEDILWLTQYTPDPIKMIAENTGEGFKLTITLPQDCGTISGYTTKLFGTFYQDGTLYYTTGAITLTAVSDYDSINFRFDYGWRLTAFSGSTSPGYFDFFLPGTIVLKK